ncbi:phosphatidate cytidylyltransferase [Chitinophaga sp.]|uniref:phosphatidate cytidylyltransferase n=1 Tax=Chitinophaga sp. TaxID=1869181 RepID=UPI0031D02DF7
MKNLQLALLGFAIILLSSCEVVGGIFKAGVWTGIIGVAVVVFLIIFLIGRGRK